MVECNLIGLFGYIVAFLFFFLGGILISINAFNQYRTGNKYGFNFDYKFDDWFLNTPFKSFITSILSAIIGYYLSLIYLIPILFKYLECLSS